MPIILSIMFLINIRFRFLLNAKCFGAIIKLIIQGENFMNKIASFFATIKNNWKQAPEGKYVSYKEIAAYSVGGAGVYFIISLVGMIALSANSMIVGASIGIKAIDLQTMNVVSTLIMLLIAPIRAMMFDNTKSKMGKFRPYLLTMGVPTAILGILFVWLPYENMDYNQKLISVFTVYTLLQFFSPFYQSAYSSLVQVMSPNSSERSWIIEISSIIYSFAPTVINPVLPLLGPLEDIKTYRVAFPIFFAIGVAVSMLCVFGTKERTIVPKQYVQKVGFFEGLKKISKNKYFWIINVSSWLSFLSAGYSYLFQWVFYYGMNNSALYSVMTLIRGEAYTPGMALAAPLTNKLGKKNICLITMLAQAVCILLMLTCYENYILFFALMFLKDFFSAFAIIFLPAMKADMMDYQQYKTGDRLEGFIDQSGVMIGSILGLATGYVIPFILKLNGLTNNYDDLFNADFRNPLIKVIIILSFVGMLLSAVPFFFYDLTEEKRGAMVKVFKLRSYFADYEENKENTDLTNEIIEIINNAKENPENEGSKIILEELDKLLRESTSYWNICQTINSR